MTPSMSSNEKAGLTRDVVAVADLPPLVEISRRNSTIVGCLALIVLAFLIGSFACSMNATFYLRHAPFFDSCGYNNVMARTITTTRKEGLLKAIELSNLTNYLPWLETAVLTKLFPRLMTVARTTGVWLQISWAVPMLLSLFIYFHVVRKFDAIMAFACTIVFVSMPMMWSANGGFSDFRMDLGLYFFFSLTAIWFLATFDTDKWYPWILLGVSAGLTGLMRATSPVYLFVAIGPPLLVRIIVSKDRMRLLIRSLAAAAIAGLVCGWFFIVTFENLRFYYMDWNIDSHTDTTLKQSLQHYKYVQNHLGKPILWLCLAFGLVIFFTQGTWRLIGRLRSPLRLLGDVNWTALWIGIAPVTMLILQRAGPNPFVSMPACFGVLMFILLFDSRPSPARRPAWLGMGMAALATIFLVRIALSGVPAHTAAPAGVLEGDMPSQRQVLMTVLLDAKAHQKKQFTFAGSTLMAFHSIGAQNVLTFDFGFKCYGSFHRRGDTVVLFDQTFQPAAAVELRLFADDPPKPKGKEPTPEELREIEAVEEKRINALVARANANVDYMVFTDDETLTYAETSFARRNYANVISRRLRDRVLASGGWEPLGDPIRMAPKEMAQIYANRNHFAPSTQPAK